MRTLHIDLGSAWRGGQNQALLLMQGLGRRGHTAELIAPESSPLARRAADAGVAVHPVARTALRVRAALAVRACLREKTFDIVHTHDAHSLTAAWLARAQRRTSLLASRRVAFPLATGRFALARYSSARKVLAVSRRVAGQVAACGLPSERVVVVHDGVDLPRLPPAGARHQARRCWNLPEGSMVLGCLGTLEPGKGQELLLRALAELSRSFPRLRLLLAGEGPLRGYLEELARKLNPGERVRFAGHVEDLSLFFEALDIFVLPSLAEGLGSALLMAMARGLASVAYADTAAAEVIASGQNGLLASPTTPGALAENLACLLGNEALRRRLGEAARRTIENQFTVDDMVDKTLRVYQSVLRQGADE